MDYYLDLVQSVKKKYRLCKEAFLPQAVFSDESENFRKPAEPSAEDFVEISILTGRNNASAVCLCVDDKRLLMERYAFQISHTALFFFHRIFCGKQMSFYSALPMIARFFPKK